MRRPTFLLLTLLTIAGCSDVTVLTKKPLVRLDDQSSYAIEDFDNGFTVTVVFRQVQFIPDASAVTEQCKSLLTNVAYEYAAKLNRKIEPVNMQRMRIASARNGLNATTSCSATAPVTWLKAMPIRAQPAISPKAIPSGSNQEFVAVLELDGVNASKSQLAALTEELRAQLLQSGNFRIVDRQQIDAILNEQALQQSGCTSQECAVRVGKILGVRKIIVGRVTKIEDKLWQLAAQMVDVESAETVRAVTVNQSGAFDVLLTDGVGSLVDKLTASTSAIH